MEDGTGARGRPACEGSTTAASSDDSREPTETAPSMRSAAPGVEPGAAQAAAPELTETALKQLNQAHGSRRGAASSTGGTTANTRATDVTEVHELADVPECAELPEPAQEHAFNPPTDPLMSIPPPLVEGLPVVSLHDIAVMEQKQGRRARRVRSHRGSAASHASLSAIPENIEITPLHARSDRSDSMRPGGLTAHGIGKLADVLEFEVDSRSNTGGSRATDSPRSSSTVLTSGDDSLMPPAVDHDYDMHIPLFSHPRAYIRGRNATESYRWHRQQASTASSVLRDLEAVQLKDQSIGTDDRAVHRQPIVTDDSGLKLTKTVVLVDGHEQDELSEQELQLRPPSDGDESEHRVRQGTVQQETVHFVIPEAVDGLMCVKKYAVGELAWNQTFHMGSFDAGVHQFTFPPSQVPSGNLTLGAYQMKTVFMDTHGQYLWAGMNDFVVTKK